MILYQPTDGEVYPTNIQSRPRTCFLMTKLGSPIPKAIKEIRSHTNKVMRNRRIKVIDANSTITGGDFLIKIWRQIVSVPLGIAIIHENLPSETLSNIFYEIGMMQAYGKQTLLVKTLSAKIPSDFVRTEYIEIDRKFESNLNKFLNDFFALESHFEMMANQLENNPLLSIDYLRRAYLISGNKELRKKAREFFESADLEERAKSSVETLLVNF